MINHILRLFVNGWRHSPFYHVSKSSHPIRWGIIGLGNMAEIFSTAIDGNRNGVVAAVASRSMKKAKKFAKRHGNCAAYGSYEDMLSDTNLNLDIVYIATPVSCHYDNIKLCLELGKNVICEKPITLSVRELKQLIEIADNNDCFIMEGMWMKCLPSFRKACQWIKDGEIGNIEFIKADFYKREIINPKLAIFNPIEGGVIKDFGIYAVAFIVEFLGGDPEEISYQTRYSLSGIDTDWVIMAVRGHRKASVNLSSDFKSLSKAAVVGSNGSIEWDSQFNRTNCVKLYNSEGRLVSTYKTKYKFDGFEHEVNEVHACIQKGLKSSKLAPISKTISAIKVIERLINGKNFES